MKKHDSHEQMVNFYSDRLKKRRILRGECVECGASEARGKCDCSSKTAALLTEQEVREAAERGRKSDPDGWQKQVDAFHSGLKRMLGQDKQADVDPNIRSSVVDAAANGNDVQAPLLRNPYEAGLGADPKQAMEFENGYQFAQSLGHLQLNQAQQPQIASWAGRGPAWREGFAEAARGMGCGQLAQQLKAASFSAFDYITKHAAPLYNHSPISAGIGYRSIENVIEEAKARRDAGDQADDLPTTTVGQNHSPMGGAGGIAHNGEVAPLN